MSMRCRGIRGATTVDANQPEAILEATTELLAEMMRANDLQVEDVASAFFTTTRDLNAEFPAVAANRMGFDDVALLCGHEMDVPGSLHSCLRPSASPPTPSRSSRPSSRRQRPTCCQSRPESESSKERRCGSSASSATPRTSASP